jgi:hypothetical protein
MITLFKGIEYKKVLGILFMAFVMKIYMIERYLLEKVVNNGSY